MSTRKPRDELRYRVWKLRREGRTQKEIAEIMGIGEEYVRTLAKGLPEVKPKENVTPPPYRRGYVWNAGIV